MIRIAGVSLVFVFFLGACTSANRGVDKSEAKPVDDAGAAEETAPLSGKYQCTWRQGESTSEPGCEITLQAGEKTFVLTTSNRTLQGSLEATEYGFHFSGTLKSATEKSAEALEADFFHQGPGSYSTVLSLKDKTLIKLDLGPTL